MLRPFFTEYPLVGLGDGNPNRFFSYIRSVNGESFHFFLFTVDPSCAGSYDMFLGFEQKRFYI